MKIERIRAELVKRLKSMEVERDKLRELEGEIADHADRMGDACDSIRYAIERLSEVV